jgi:hypothetical protein
MRPRVQEVPGSLGREWAEDFSADLPSGGIVILGAAPPRDDQLPPCHGKHATTRRTNEAPGKEVGA